MPRNRQSTPVNSVALLVLACLTFSSCSYLASDEALYQREAPLSKGEAKVQREQRKVSSSFEWAVQDFEAGNYEAAIKKFTKLRSQGTIVGDYDLISFYLGMSKFHLGKPKEAVIDLEDFLKTAPARQESQDARIALLLSYESLADWTKTLGLAVEMEPMTLFQYNRAILKLVWARALREQGEVLGAKAVLKESAQYLDQATEEGRSFQIRSNANLDLWGRYFFVSASIRELECRIGRPKELTKTRRLYGPWLESSADCFRAAINEASKELFFRESVWSSKAAEALNRGLTELGSQISGYVKLEEKSIPRKQALQKSAYENLYRVLGTVDDQLKVFKKHNISTVELETLRKRIDLLLVSISSPS